MADIPPLLKAALQLRAETDLSRLFLPVMDDTNRPPLSPAAQAVLTAFGTHPIRADHIAEDLVPALAAALCAAADQVVPDQKPWHRTSDASAAKHSVRLDLLAIAAELAADGPAVPEGREPAAVVGEPSDEGLLGIAAQSIEPCDKTSTSANR